MSSKVILSLLIVALVALVLFGWSEFQKELKRAKQVTTEPGRRLDCLNETLRQGRAAEGCLGVVVEGAGGE